MDRITTVRRVGRGEKMGRAIAGVGAGLLMFLTSFGVLWWNEGRTDMSKVAEQATITSADTVEGAVDGQLVSVSGTLNPTGTVGDPAYLAPGSYLRLNRHVEMFAWVENKKTTREKTVGGEEIERTEYNYVKQWTGSPASSDEFYEHKGHQNPKLTIEDQTFHPEGATVGAWQIADVSGSRLPAAEPVALTKANTKLPRNRRERRRTHVSETHYYIGGGSPEKPAVGDVRISWTAVPAAQSVTMFAQASGATLVPYLHEGKDELYRAVAGTHDEAIAQMATEHKVMSWILRIAGFLMMWIGMSLVFGPIHAVLDIIPMIGQGSRFLVGVVLFPVALVLSVATMVVSMIAHSAIALILTLLLLVGGGIAFFVIRRRGASPPSPEPAAA